MHEEEYNELFAVTQCPSQQQLLDYVQDRLSPEERHEVERHLADCEMCSEAVEGLAAIRHKEKIPVWLRHMRWLMLRRLRARNRRRRQVTYYLQLAITVIIILFLLLAAFWVYHFVTKP